MIGSQLIDRQSAICLMIPGQEEPGLKSSGHDVGTDSLALAVPTDTAIQCGCSEGCSRVSGITKAQKIHYVSGGKQTATSREVTEMPRRAQSVPWSLPAKAVA